MKVEDEKKQESSKKRIKRNRSKESCVLITQFYVLSVRSTSPAFVEAERSQLYHLCSATGSFSHGQSVTSLRLARARRSLLSFISHGHYLHSREYPRFILSARRKIDGSVFLSSLAPLRLESTARVPIQPRFSRNLRVSTQFMHRSYFQILPQRGTNLVDLPTYQLFYHKRAYVCIVCSTY